MKFLFLTLLFFTLSIRFVFSAQVEKKPTPVNSINLSQKQNNFQSSKSLMRLSNENVDDIIIWSEDFESGENGWSLDAGWELTENSANSPTHSVVSPNNDSNLSGTFNLLTPPLELPEIGIDETMHFGFWLHADLPDSDGDDDSYLDDYYNISVLGISESAWHSTNFNSDNGNSFWCADEDINGYLDGWIQYLDTPIITIGTGGKVSARIYYAIENPAGATGEVAGSCTDGWDAANIRISKDGGTTWALLEDSMNPYHFDCGYGWIFNDEEYEVGGTLNHLAKSWGGDSGGWIDFSSEIAEYAGEEIIIRFAFGSDPAYSTADDNTLSGFQVDAISIRDNSGLLFSEDGDDMSQLTAGGEEWTDQFYDYGSVEDGRPGSSAWEEYLPGLPFNGNTFLNISEFAGKTIKLRIQSRYDDNHDGGQGGGLYIDDFMIYKLSTGAYFAPWGLEAEAGDSEVSLVWANMNAAGTDDFAYDNGVFSSENTISTVDGTGWAGVLFDVIGPAQINSFSLYNTHGDTTINVEVYGMFGSTIDTEPTYIKEVDIVNGWNEYSVNDWNIENYFVIAHEINPNFGVALDTTQTTLHSVLRLGGTWDFALNYNVIGDFGIRANITYEGAGVSYNVYRDELSIETGLTVNGITDNDVVNNTTYEYTVSATYDDGEESGQSSYVSVTPLASTIHQESHDDGSFESEFNVGSGNFSAVKYSANALGESIMRFKWYQNGSGGAFYIKVFEDTLGMPGDEIYSTTQASGNQDGWNEKNLTKHGIVDTTITVSGDYWIGTKEFSSSLPFGLDTTSVTGFSFKRTGSDGDWIAVEGNLGYRVYIDGNPLAISESNSPYKMTLGEAYPNPFNPSTTIQFELDRFGPVSLSIYNLNGRLVNKLINDTMHPGNYNSIWNGTNLRGNQVSSGIYLAVLESNGMLVQTQKLVLLK